MNKPLYIILISFGVFLFLFVIGFIVIKKRENSKNKKDIERFDKEKNMIETSSIPSELSKVETIIKNEKMEEKYNYWCDRYDEIKDDNIVRINDMIIDLDISTDKKDFNEYNRKVAQIEMELAKAKMITDTLLDEIKEITLSEEKYRSIIIKLKTKYRELNSKFVDCKEQYQEISEIIELQFENIEKRFKDFENSMEKNEYNEVVHIVKAIDTMVDHMGIVIKEVPDLILLTKKILPKRIEQINEIYNNMIEKGYPLDYLKVEYNIEETEKHVSDIVDRIGVLNLEDCMFELKTMVEYLDSIFKEFDNQKITKRKYDEDKGVFEEKLQKVNITVTDVYNQLEDIKSTYDLKDEDLNIINQVNDNLININEDYKHLLIDVKNKKEPYTNSVRDLEILNKRLQKTDEELDVALKSLGNMYEDEARAREQLDEIQALLKQAKLKIRGFKLPIITNNYYIQLSEANDAILEIIKELERRPIVIKILNTRVDTARDLVLKLYNTTNETIEIAKISEMAIVYGNRYRSTIGSIDKGLSYAEMLFYKGDYKNSLDVSIRTIEEIESSFGEKIQTLYKKEI